MLYDNDIREIVLKNLMSEHKKDKNTHIIEELSIYFGISRIDIAILSGCIYGIEIKSRRDTLIKLPKQVEYYNSVFQYVKIICDNIFINQIYKRVPSWWGIDIVKDNKIKNVRVMNPNPFLNYNILAGFLWKEEVLALLDKYNLQKGMKNKNRLVLYEHIVKNIPEEEILSYVLSTLKERKNFKKRYISQYDF